MTTSRDETASLVPLIDRYSRVVTPIVLEQQPEASVSSPLGIWLLLAATASAAQGAARQELEEALGCSAGTAGALLSDVFDAPPAALAAALAVWVQPEVVTPDFTTWASELPQQVEHGPIPTRTEADAWVAERTLGLITRFPLEGVEAIQLMLASAVATKVSWQTRFSVVAARDYLRGSSPWCGRVDRILFDGAPSPPSMLATTDAAGVVALHVARAVEDLAVFSVVADPEVDRAAVFGAAYELAARCRERTLESARLSLFDVPLGDGHSWSISETEEPWHTSEPAERVKNALVPAWHVNGQLDLLRSASFGARASTQSLQALLGARGGNILGAGQGATAMYTPEGFAAGAVTYEFVATSRRPDPTGTRKLREATLRFDHPYAAVALAGRSTDYFNVGAGISTDPLFCLPLFAAWVDEPTEATLPPEDAPANPDLD